MQDQGLIARLLRHEAAGGVVLMIAAAFALIVANSGLAARYDAFLSAELSVLLNGQGLQKPLILWINDGLMAVFFFLIGLELKREMLEGKLKNPRDIMLPGLAAIGGMAVPALVFVLINRDAPQNLSGWAIPAATDIAFAVGVLALLGRRVPAALKVFLLTLAILDDLGAIIIIALFYTASLKLGWLAAAGLPLALMLILNLKGAHRPALILLLGAALWFCVLKSGVHATLAGVITAFFIPLTDRFGKSPLHSVEHGLTPYVYFFVVPVFAFANAGVVLAGMRVADILQPLPLGIALGLFVGKQVGVFGATWLCVRAGLARLPAGVGWAQVYGVACLAGIGFTMSLFIGSLSFADPAMMNDVRLGVLSGSILSAILGYAVLRMAQAPGLDGQRAAAAHEVKRKATAARPAQ
jgi:NhaA family Na+:H+ antiporter